MAYRFFQTFRSKSGKPGGFDLTQKLEVLLLMTNTTVLTDADSSIVNLASFTTLDEHAGTNYVRKDIYLLDEDDDGKHWSNNAALNARVNQLVWTALGAGARSVKGILIASKSDHPDYASIPIYYRDLATPLPSNGEDYKINLNVEVESVPTPVFTLADGGAS